MHLYALELRFPTPSEPRIAVHPSHRAYLEQLRRAGNLVAAGPWSDDSGALIIYRAADEAEVEALLAADPYFADDLGIERTLREWRPILGGEIPSS